MIKNKQDALRSTLRDDIQHGLTPPGTRLPSEHQLMQRFEVSRTTVRGALASLVDEGLVLREQGRGSFIAPDAVERLRAQQRPGLPLLRVGFVCGLERLGNPMVQSLLDQLDKRIGTIAELTLHYHDRPQFERYVGADVLVVDASYHQGWLREIDGARVIVFNQQHRSLPFIVTDNRAGGATMAQHVLDLGHRRIGLIRYVESGPKDEFGLRYRGMRETLEAAGLGWSEVAIAHAQRLTITPVELVDRLLRAARQRPTAVLCEIDALALAVIERFGELGIRVPEDVSVVGYDDLPTVGRIDPPLTTVRQDLVTLAERLAGMLAQIQRGIEADRSPPVMPRLIVRGSTAPPADSAG